MLRELARTGRRWGRFDVTIAGRAPALKLIAAMMNARSRLTGIATGDQGIFVDRALFAAVGGYPDQPLMEDIELSKRLKRAGGPPLCVRERVATSGRRWERHGIWRTIIGDVALAPRLLAQRGHCAAGRAVPGTERKSPSTLQIFAKSPVPGTVKTRLAAAIGDDAAAAVYVRFVDMTLATAAAARAAGLVDRIELWCAPDVDAEGFAAWRDRYPISLRAQSGADLGANACATPSMPRSRAGRRAILVGTDCPALDLAYLARAVAALDDARRGIRTHRGRRIRAGRARPQRRRVRRHPVEHAGRDGGDARDADEPARVVARTADALRCG